MEKKILVVDDEPKIVQVITSRLKANHYETCAAFDGMQAVHLAHEQKPDLIILDVMLPGVDGYTLASQFSEGDATRDLPIIVMSGLEPSGAMFKQFSQVAAFMTKPFNPADLVETVGKALAKKNK